jgi:branched-chain amino acid transport system permease protein
MFDSGIIFSSLLNGLTTGAVYALIALGLTLIYGVLHIINFAHGAALMLALYSVYFLKEHLGVDPYLALPLVVPGMFALGYALQRIVINRASHGKDENILLVTLGLSIIMENAALLFFKSDTRTIETAYTLTTVAICPNCWLLQALCWCQPCCCGSLERPTWVVRFVLWPRKSTEPN